MKQLLQKLTSYLKRQPVLPAWLRKGVIIGMQGGTEAVSIHEGFFFSLGIT